MRTKATRTLAILGVLWATWLTDPVVGQDQAPEHRAKTPIEVFEIQERFGVSHPNQIIDFDLTEKIDSANTFMIGLEGEETVYQLIEGGKKVAVRTDLPAGAKKAWMLVQGHPTATSPSAIRVEEKPGCFEITSGPTGVRVPRERDVVQAKGNGMPAPIQGIRLRDGTWTADGPNQIKTAGQLKKMHVRFLECGPLKVVVEVAYEVERPERLIGRGHVASVDPAAGTITLSSNNYLDRVRMPEKLVRFAVGNGDTTETLPLPLTAGKTYYAASTGPDTYRLAKSREGPPLKLDGGLSGRPAVLAVIPGGMALCKTTIIVQAGQPSILFEQESDVQASYALDFGTALKLNQARYRGHHSSSKEAGYEQDGSMYRAWHERPSMDAFFDFPFDRDYGSQYTTDLGNGPVIRRMAVWDPWVYDSGWYWQAYDREGGADSHLVGLFAGRPSRALWANNSGAGFYTRCPQSGGPAVGVDVQMNLSCPSEGIYPHTRFQWGLFAGSKGSDLAPPDQVQPVARQMNLHAGINLNKIHRLVTEFPDPPAGYGSPYMPRAVVERMIEKLRKDTQGQHGQGYHGYLAHADPSARDLIEMWADASGEKVQAVVNGIEEEARSLLDAFVNEDGIYTMRCHYWHGGLAMSRRLFWIDQVLGSKSATPDMRARVKAVAALFGAVLWDNDFVPMDNQHGLNLGTPNMPVQQAGYRNQYALFLARHPMMRGHVEATVEQTAKVLRHDINEVGAHLSCVHYVGAGMGPTLTMMQQLKMAHVKDFFRDEPRVAKFAEFYMNCTAPPEPRFGSRRKNISVGDSATEPSELFGQMATGFADVQPALSKRLASLWQAQDKPHSSFHGTTLLKIDEDLPIASPQLGSANFFGQFSVLRTGWNTPTETAVWLVNGNHYWDHSHCDQGTVVLYALGAPVSIDWGPIYYPRVAGAFYHSVALPENVLKHPWDKASPPLDAGEWGTYAGTTTTQDEFRAASDGGWVRVSMTAPDGKFTWTRAVSLARLTEDLPVIAIQDSYTGNEAAAAKVFTLNLMADGPVETPAGKVTPPERIWGYQSHFGDRQELASAGRVITLNPGVNRLRFTGHVWKSHPTQGVDFDVYVVADDQQQAHVGNWAHAWAGGSGNEFRQANDRLFEERQHILRLRSTGGFQTFLVVYPKGGIPADLQVRRDGAQVVVSAAGRTVRFGSDGKYGP